MFCLVTDKENSLRRPGADIFLCFFFFSPAPLSFRLTIFFLRLFGEAPELFKNALNVAGSSPNIKCSLIMRKGGKKELECVCYSGRTAVSNKSALSRGLGCSKKEKKKQ